MPPKTTKKAPGISSPARKAALVPEEIHPPARPAAPRPLKILIVDDHPMMRVGMRQTLAKEFTDAVLREASDAQQALELVWNEEWDIVLLDITMPGRSGLDGLKELKQVNPKLPVLIVSVHSEEQFAIRVLQRGAAGYLTKETAGAELVDAVKRILSGGKYIRASLAEKLAGHLHRGSSDRHLHETLSDREYQVMCMLALGKTVKEIANELSLSIKTISTYRTRILEKTGMKNNSEIMRYAVEHELVDFPQRKRTEE